MPNDHGKTPNIIVAEELDPADVAVITDGLRANYVNQAVHYDFRPLVVFVRDPQTGKVADIKTSFRSAPKPDLDVTAAALPQPTRSCRSRQMLKTDSFGRKAADAFG